MKKYLLIIALLLLVGCSDNNSFKVGMASNIRNNNDKEELRSILKDEDASNIDVFFSWVDNFNKEKDLGCGIVNKWAPIDKIKYNDTACMDRYEKNHEIMDGNCRITAFTLIMNSISVNKKISDVGSYLMFDMDVIDNNKDYKIVKENKDKFITLFNEIDVSDYENDNIKDAYSNKIKEYGITFNNDDISLISILMHDKDNKIVFVGHAGVLLQEDDKYIFIEKIAFEQPYQVSVLKSKEELRNMLFKRDTYFEDGSEEGPFIYENDKLLYSY